MLIMQFLMVTFKWIYWDHSNGAVEIDASFSLSVMLSIRLLGRMHWHSVWRQFDTHQTEL